MHQRHARDHDYSLDILHTNIEGEAINRIYQGVDDGPNGLVGYAWKHCIKVAGLPIVEVHISSISKHNIHCVLSGAAEGMITGFGMHSYILGLDAMLEILRTRA